MKNSIYFHRHSILLFKIALVIGLASSCSKTADPKVESPTACTSKNMNAFSAGDPHYNLNVFFTGAKTTICGYLEFRQTTDNGQFIHLDTWVHGLEPNTNYLLQRAVDTMLDGNCTSVDWLTLGKGLTAASILTDGNGDGYAELYRSVMSIAVGTKFDIHFQIIKESDSAMALTSDCYQYTVR